MGFVFHEIVYGGNPPVKSTVAVPSSPEHPAGVELSTGSKAFTHSKKSMKTPESNIPSPASAIAILK